MCFTANVSLITFLVGVVGSIFLMKYGNPKFHKENITSGIFLLFIAGIQLMEFLFWIDINNTIGINKITTIIGSLFNVGQPLFLYITKILYFTPKNILSIENFNLPVFILNIFYLLNVVIFYISFINSSTIITRPENGHLSWPWIKYSNPIFYILLLAINIFYLMDFKYAFVFFIITYLFFILSVVFFSYNIGELWCFFGVFIPYLMIIASYII
jgi:hypothetical protein